MNIFEQSSMNPTFIFVDGSYYCFYRFYALTNWWRNAYPDDPLDEPFENPQFVEKFKKTFVERLQEIPKKLNIHKTTNPILVVGKDCKRENIWRMELFPKYKSNRVKEGFAGGPFFKMAYEEDLFQKGGVQAILKHPHLEADDCIAISVKHLLVKYPSCQIYIITSDKDYLQLSEPRVHIYNLAFKNIVENNSSTGNALTDLEIKIIMGDTSDCIPSVFPKCGIKTAKKCIEDPEFFKKKMADKPEYYAQFELNKKLVNFDNIPVHLLDEFMETICKTKKATHNV
jgi:5'-3' exonuclease